MAGLFYYRRGPLGLVHPSGNIGISRINNNRRPGGIGPGNENNRRPGDRGPGNENNRRPGGIGPGNENNRRPGDRGPGNENNRRPGGIGPGNENNRRPGGIGPGNENNRRPGGIGPGNENNRRPGGIGPGNENNRRPRDRYPRNEYIRRPEDMPPKNNYEKRPDEQRNPYGRRNNLPPGPPPTQIPNKKKNYDTYAVNPGAIRLCQNRYTYVWLNDGREFWIWLAYVGRRSIAGYRWSWGRRRWIVFGTDISNINEFECY